MTVLLRYENARRYADLVFQNGAFLEGAPLDTAVIISLFTERRAENDNIEVKNTYQGGWWGDTYRETKIGSRLWLLRKRKATNDTLADAKAYIEEALQWMLDDGVATSITVTTQRDVTRMDTLLFSISIQRPGQSTPWQRTWEVQFNEL